MRKNIEKIEKCVWGVTHTVIEEKVIYIANDGKEFTSKDECEKWEQSANCTVNAQLRPLIHDIYCGLGFGVEYADDETTVYMIKPKTFGDITALNYVANAFPTDAKFSANDIGKYFLLIYNYPHSDYDMLSGDWLSIYDADEYLTSIIDNYAKAKALCDEVKE